MPSSENSKRLYIKTYGCQMNAYDSERMEESLLPLGFKTIASPEDADLIIINTCHIRAKAEDKLFSDLGRFHKIRKGRDPQATSLLVVAGCVGQALGASILKRAPYVDVIIGPQTIHTLPETIVRLLREKGMPHISMGFPKMAKFDELPARTLKSASYQAFLTIQEGCNKFCRYCVVPYTRGPEYSRPVEDVLREARQLVEQGAKELMLLGQNVNAYHGVDASGKVCGLGELLMACADIPGLHRLRYMTSHPRDVDDALIAAHRDLDVLMPILHLPVQSGSDKILAQMNRNYTRAFYLDILERFRKAKPSIAFSSDFIVGYPGESEEDFEDTCQLALDVQFAQSYSFTYSPRPGTPAALLPQIPEDIQKERLYRLQDQLNQHRKQFNDGCVGQTFEVLVESARDEGWMGRSPFSQPVHFKDPHAQVGDILSVHIQASHMNSLAGVLQKNCAQKSSPSFL